MRKVPTPPREAFGRHLPGILSVSGLVIRLAIVDKETVVTLLKYPED